MSNVFKLELNLEEVNNVLAALGKLPYEVSYTVIDKIKDQATPQINKPEVCEEKSQECPAVVE